MAITITESSAQHWALRFVGVATLAAIALYFASGAAPSTLGKITEACTLAIAAIALNLLLGFNGQISLGHSAFAGLAAFTAGYSVNAWHWNPWLSLLISCAVCFAFGMLVGLPALRLKGSYLALVTLAVAFVWPTVARKFLNQTVRQSTLTGMKLKPPTWTGLANNRADRALFLFWLSIALLIVAYVVVRNIRKSRIGRSLVAVRDNETAAAVMGVNLPVTKTITFGISASLAGLAGWLTAAQLTTLDENSFSILTSIKYLLALILGGAATLAGPVVGAFVYFFVDDLLKTNAPHWDFLPGPLSNGPVASFLLGAMVITFVFIAPAGFVGLIKSQTRRIAIVVPRPLRYSTVAEASVEERESP